jgi:hypothetical protein
MATAARRALKWKEEGRPGGTLVGLARANQLKDREPLSEATVLRMYSFFSRHEPDKKATGFNILAQNLQKGLNSKCGSKLVTDGKFGSLTEAALMKCYNVNQADFALYNQIIS